MYDAVREVRIKHECLAEDIAKLGRLNNIDIKVITTAINIMRG